MRHSKLTKHILTKLGINPEKEKGERHQFIYDLSENDINKIINYENSKIIRTIINIEIDGKVYCINSKQFQKYNSNLYTRKEDWNGRD